MEEIKSAKTELYEKIQRIAYNFGLDFIMDDVNEKYEILFILNRNSCSYVLHYDTKKEFFAVQVLSAKFSGRDDKRFNFPTIEGCMECLSALDFYHMQIIDTVKYF